MPVRRRGPPAGEAGVRDARHDLALQEDEDDGQRQARREAAGPRPGPLEVLVVDPQADGLRPFPGGLPGLLQHVGPLLGRRHGHHAPVGAGRARLPQHVLAVEAEVDVNVEGQGVELAVDDGPLPQFGVEVLLPHAVFGEQAEVPGVQEAARREAGGPAEVHDARVGRPAARRGHGEFGAEGAAPPEGGVLHVGAGAVLPEGVRHRDRVVAVAAAEEVPVPHPRAGVAGQDVRAGAEGREAEAARDRQAARRGR